MTSNDGSLLAWAQDTLSTFLPLLDMAFAMFNLSHITLPFASYMLIYSLAVIDDSLNIIQRILATTKQILCFKVTCRTRRAILVPSRRLPVSSSSQDFQYPTDLPSPRIPPLSE